VIDIGKKLDITGRGRVAPEGLNCTLTGSPQNVRSFCEKLREWNDIFHETDFKLTDGVSHSRMFKNLSIRKTNELVAYGLSGEKAPSLKKFGGTHLEASDYHKAMADSNTVIVDVRNAYETAIGSFRPPEGGAKLIDPKMRNSIEFPKWLSDKKTQEQLSGKKVLMYCTGGIRCERATALLNQMSAVDENLKPAGVYHCRGGIDRYMKTFPEGGYWNGKNYLFDRRMEQTPSVKAEGAVEEDIDSKCCLCHGKWTVYRGKFKCCNTLCGVPVIVCESCKITATKKPEALVCELCREGHKNPTALPDLVGQKRKADRLVENDTDRNGSKKQSKVNDKEHYHGDRLFLRRLPLYSTFTKIKEALGPADVRCVHWLSDKESGAFYGSCIVQVSDDEAAQRILKRHASVGVKFEKKKMKMAHVVKKDGDDDTFSISSFAQKEYPPLGVCC